jgi:CheY-like chemotaxis protein
VEQLPEQETLVVADPHYLKQIVLNLVLNAIDAMKNSFRKELLLRIRLAAGQVLLDVSDTGAGIPPEILPRIFDPFFTSKSAETSRGLGLSVSRSLAKQFQGEVLVETAVGEGTTFTLRLPQSKVRPAAPPPDPAPVVPTVASVVAAEPLRPPEILVVDDEDNVGNLVKEILRRKLNGNVRRAVNGEEAIKEMETTNFDLVVSDVRMPVKNGLELFRWVAANRPDTVPRFLFMTGHDGTNDMSDEIARSQVPVLRKPFAVDLLVKQCQSRLETAGGLRSRS